MRYQFIQDHQAEFNLALMLRMLEVSSSGFYDWHRVTHVGRDEGHKALEIPLIKSF
jgi:hypothetical protein